METLVIVSIFLAIALSVVGFVLLLRYKHFGEDKITKVDEKLNALDNMLDSCDKMIHELNNLSDYIISNVEEKSKELKGLMEKADSKIEQIKTQPRHEFSVSTPVHVPVQVKPETKPPVEDKQEDKVQGPLLKLSGKFKKVNQEEEKDISKEVVELPMEPARTTSVPPMINAYQASMNFAKEPVEEKEPESVQIPEPEQKPVEEPRLFEPVIIERKDETPDKGKMFAFVVSSKAKDVIELSNQGLDTTEIAKRLGIGKGEIELILGMKK